MAEWRGRARRNREPRCNGAGATSRRCVGLLKMQPTAGRPPIIGSRPNAHDRAVWHRDHMARKMVIELPDGTRQMLEQVPADHELQLQERLKLYPELLPLEELGLAGPAVVVGRESSLDSGRVDLVLLGNGGDLALVEFKTGPQNPDFR